MKSIEFPWWNVNADLADAMEFGWESSEDQILETWLAVEEGFFGPAEEPGVIYIDTEFSNDSLTAWWTSSI